MRSDRLAPREGIKGGLESNSRSRGIRGEREEKERKKNCICAGREKKSEFR